MKIYVAGKFEEKRAVRQLQDALIAEGHSITYDWTKHEDATADKASCAVNDLVGVVDADAIILLWHPGLKGGLVELGAALALEKVTIVVGCPKDQPCIFFHHPEIFNAQSPVNMGEIAMLLASGVPP